MVFYGFYSHRDTYIPSTGQAALPSQAKSRCRILQRGADHVFLVPADTAAEGNGLRHVAGMPGFGQFRHLIIR